MLWRENLVIITNVWASDIVNMATQAHKCWRGRGWQHFLFKKQKKCAQVMNVGWPYLRDILYVGPLFIATELSTSLRKYAPAAPGRTETVIFTWWCQKVCPSVCALFVHILDVDLVWASCLNKWARPSYCFNLSPTTRTAKAKQSLKKNPKKKPVCTNYCVANGST